MGLLSIIVRALFSCGSRQRREARASTSSALGRNTLAKPPYATSLEKRGDYRTLAAGLLAASSFAFAADNNGGKNNNNGGKDNMTTGSINDPVRPDMEDAEKCREHVAGGAPCQEPGTTMDSQQ
jgi:hypothetical protein